MKDDIFNDMWFRMDSDLEAGVKQCHTLSNTPEVKQVEIQCRLGNGQDTPGTGCTSIMPDLFIAKCY